MKDRALIGKFIGFWPTEHALQGWITTKWKPKAHFHLQLGSKGFFTLIFHHLDDTSKVEGDPYFLRLANISRTGWNDSAQKNAISHGQLSGSRCTPYQKNTRMRKPSNKLATQWEPMSDLQSRKK